MENTILCRQPAATMSHDSLATHPASTRLPNPFNLQTCQPALRSPLRLQLHGNCEKLTPLFSHSSALFCHGQNAKPFLFRRFRTLSQKHPGWRTPQLLSTPDPCTDSQKHAPASPLLATLTDAFNHKPCVCHSYKNTGVYTLLHQNFHSLCLPLRGRHPPGIWASAVLAPTGPQYI